MKMPLSDDMKDKLTSKKGAKTMGELQDRMKMDMELKNFSPKTIKTYLGCMKSFTRHFGKSPKDLGDEEIRDYLHYLLKEKMASQATISQTYSALKFFYERTLGKDWNERKIPRSKLPKKLPTVLAKEEVRAIFLNTQNIKHLALLMTIYSGGLRLSEATHLKPGDIDSKRMMIKVRGKGNKDRYTLLGEKALDILRIYFRQYRPSEWLFSSRNPEVCICNSTVQKAFKVSLKKSGVKKKASVHTLRHCFATHLLESGADLFYIQRLMGHTTSKTTAVYLHVTQKSFTKMKSPVDLLGDSDEPIL